MYKNEQPLYIKIHAKDNVAIIVNDGGLGEGTQFSDGLTLREYIPQGHKVALYDIETDEPIIRYGEVVGYAKNNIERGGLVNEKSTRMPDVHTLKDLPIATRTPPDLPPLEGYTFQGYRNADGSVGTRNLLGITTSVNCVVGVLDYAVKLIKEKLLHKYPNVDGVVALNYIYGCGVAIDAPAATIPIRSIRNIALNPNFGGEIMIVSLGCEKLQPDRLKKGQVGDIPLTMEEEDTITLQEITGFKGMVDNILSVADKHLQRLNTRTRETVPASELIVGMQCGGSDAFSGVTSNPSVGYASDLLVRCGATVMFSEVTEVRDAIHLLTPRAINEEVGQALIREMAWYDNYLSLGEADRSANTTPGNKKGGLNNIVEKAMGSAAKSGNSAIVEVLSHGERPTKKGLIFAATPSGDFFCGTQQLASGITLQVFTTGRGNPYSLEAIPVIKMSSRDVVAERWFDLIDISAGGIAKGECNIEDVGWKLFHLILEVASGKKTWAEHWGISNPLAVFNPGPLT